MWSEDVGGGKVWSEDVGGGGDDDVIICHNLLITDS